MQLSDKIAYINHDIDDAIRGGILREEDLPKKYTDILGNRTKDRLNTMVHDVITYSMDKPAVNMSPEVEWALKGLREFMFENVYQNPVAKSEEVKAIHMITNLYEYYMKHIDALPKEYIQMMEEREIRKEQIICDYIAGMTDTYAVKKFQEYFIPESWKI